MRIGLIAEQAEISCLSKQPETTDFEGSLRIISRNYWHLSETYGPREIEDRDCESHFKSYRNRPFVRVP